MKKSRFHIPLFSWLNLPAYFNCSYEEIVIKYISGCLSLNVTASDSKRKVPDLKLLDFNRIIFN